MKRIVKQWNGTKVINVVASKKVNLVLPAVKTTGFTAGTVLALNLMTGKTERISSDEFKASNGTRYLAASSKKAKEWKEQNLNVA